MGGGGGGSLMRTGSSRRFVLRRSPLRVKLNSLSAVVTTAGYKNRLRLAFLVVMASARRDLHGRMN